MGPHLNRAKAIGLTVQQYRVAYRWLVQRKKHKTIGHELKLSRSRVSRIIAEIRAKFPDRKNLFCV